jgi:hypothetical protein
MMLLTDPEKFEAHMKQKRLRRSLVARGRQEKLFK